MAKVAPAVSRETPSVCIYQRLIEWAAWASDRQHVPDRRDDVAGDFRITQAVWERLDKVKKMHWPAEIHAIEKAVASLRMDRGDDLLLHSMVLRYFLEWRTVETIAIEQNMSEFHVVEYLHRAMRHISARAPATEAVPRR